MEINDKPNNNLDDVFLTDIDEQSCQKIISQIEEQRAIETIKNSSYNEAFLSVCEKENKEAYERGFNNGKNYSMKFGEVLGRIEAFFSLVNNDMLQATENDIESLKLLKGNMENYTGMLSPEILSGFLHKTNSIISKYIKIE